MSVAANIPGPRLTSVLSGSNSWAFAVLFQWPVLFYKLLIVVNYALFYGCFTVAELYKNTFTVDEGDLFNKYLYYFLVVILIEVILTCSAPLSYW